MLPHERLVFRAATCRILLGIVAIALLPVLYPGMTALRPIVGVYLGAVGVELVMIRARVGGSVRAYVFGLIDLALLTLLVHRAGSVGTSLVTLYFLAGVLNALVVGLRVGLVQAALGALAYSTTVMLEHAHVLAYAPDAPPGLVTRGPTFAEAITSSLLVSTMLLASTAVIGLLLRSLRDREDALQELSRRDALTHLWNRRHLLERIEEGLAYARRGRPLALVMLDLDRFKKVNDGQGHLRGDLLLQEIASALQGSIRETDVAARYGGDEFVVLLLDTDEEAARSVAERVVAAIRDAASRFGADVTASAGVALAHPDDTPAALLRRADENAYRAKRSGGDRFVLAA